VQIVQLARPDCATAVPYRAARLGELGEWVAVEHDSQQAFADTPPSKPPARAHPSCAAYAAITPRRPSFLGAQTIFFSRGLSFAPGHGATSTSPTLHVQGLPVQDPVPQKSNMMRPCTRLPPDTAKTTHTCTSNCLQPVMFEYVRQEAKRAAWTYVMYDTRCVGLEERLHER